MSAPTRVRRDRINIRRDDVRLDFVGGNLLGRPAMMNGIKQAEQLPGSCRRSSPAAIAACSSPAG